MKKWTQAAMYLLFAVSMYGQSATAGQPDAVPILLKADLPTYPPVWRTAHLSGTVVVLVKVKDGRVVQTEVKSGESHLQVPTVENLKTWQFEGTVNDQFTVTYNYKISGDPTDEPTNPKVEMLPSLDVTISARPVKPICMDCGAPPMKVLPPK